MPPHHPPHLRIIGGLDEALRHSRGENVAAKEHRIPVRQRLDAERYERACAEHEGKPFVIFHTPPRDYADIDAAFVEESECVEDMYPPLAVAIDGFLAALGDWLNDGKFAYGFVAGCFVCLTALIAGVKLLA